MKSIIFDKSELFFIKNFPYKNKKLPFLKYDVTIGIGGNVGNTIRIFNKLFLILQKDNKFHILRTSPLLKNPAFGFTKQKDFINCVMILQTNLSAHIILREMQKYEYRFKRKRTFKNAPRTLDIDIIFIEKNNKQILINSKDLNVPHVFWHERDSVKIPLAYTK